MFCTNCGKEIPNGSAFCQECGAAQSGGKLNKGKSGKGIGFLGDGRMLFIFAIICFYIYWKKINTEREGVALVALAGNVGVLVIEMLLIWMEMAPFFAYPVLGG